MAAPDVHPTAIVSPKAELADDVSIGPYVVIGPGVKLGARTKVHSHACLDGVTTLGTDNVIGRHACIGAAPQDIKYKGEETYLVVGDNNFFGDFSQLCRGTLKSHDRTTRVGNNNFIMAYSHVGHDCIVSDYCVLANGVQLAGHVELEDHVHFGGLSGMHQFCIVGRYSIIGGGSAGNSHVPPFTRAAGFMGPINGLNSVGLRRSPEFTDEDRRVLKEVYRIFFRVPGTMDTLVARIRERYPDNKHAAHFCDFTDRCRIGTAASRPISREKPDPHAAG